MKRAGIRRGDEVCSTTKMMKRTIKKVVPSWIRTRVVGFKVQSDDHYTNGT
jgi:hypothetical protein